MPRNITITFDDGSTHTYQNAPDDVTPDAVQARAEKEFGLGVTNIDGGRQVAPAPKAEPGFFERLGNNVKGAGEFVSGMAADTFGDKPASVLQDKVLESPAGMTPDVNIDANRFARDRSKSPQSVMYTKANATDAANKQIAKGAEVIKARPDLQSQDIERTWGEAASDTGLQLAKGAVALPQALVGIADIYTLGKAGKTLDGLGYRPDEAAKILEDLYSPAQKQADGRVQMAEGFVDTVRTALENPLSVSSSTLTSLPSMLGGAGIARGMLAGGLKVAPWLAAAVGEGAIGAGSAASEIRNQNVDRELAPMQALAAVGSGVGTAAFGALGGKLSNKLGLGDMDTMLASGTLGIKKPGFIKAVVGSGISEGAFEEMPQSGQEKMWQNFATGKPVMDGVGNAMGMGLVTGTAMGMAGGGASQIGGNPAPAPIPSALDVARSKGFLTPEGTTNTPLPAPRVEDQPTIPTAPTVTRTAAQQILDAENGTTEEAPTAKAPATNPAPEADPATLQVPTAPGDVAGPADVAAKPVATGSLSNPAPAIPTGTDPQTAAIAAIEKSLAESRARQDAAAQEWLAKEKADADAKRAAADKVASTGSNYQQKVADTVQPDGGSVPVPMQAATVVETAKAVASKNTDLADQKTYPTKVLYGIINSPEAGPELLDAARTELERRKGNPIGPKVSMQTTSTLSPQAQSLQQRMRSGQNANNGTNTTTASAGVDSAPRGAQGFTQQVTQRLGATPAVVGQGVFGKPSLSAKPTAGGSSPAAQPSRLSLAPAASAAVVQSVGTQLFNDRKVMIAPFAGQMTHGQQVASVFANMNGRTFTLVEQKLGQKKDMPNGFMIPGTKHIVVDSKAEDAPLLVAVHEIYHGMPERIRKNLNTALRSLFDPTKEAEFGRAFNVSEADFQEEIPAYIAQATASRATFWDEVRQKMGNKEFSELASYILSTFKRLMQGADTQLGEGFLQKYIGDESKILQAQTLLADAYTQSMQEQGLQPDAELTGGLRMSEKSTDESGEKRQYKLDVARDDRTVGAKASVSAAEVAAITKDATELGLNNAQIATLIENARDTRKRFPPKAGWAPIEANGVEAKKDDDGNVKLDKKGNPQVKVTWKPIAYAFNVPVGAKKSGQQMDMVHVGKVADQFTKLVNGIYDRANAGDKNAQTIVGHQTWYRNVAAILRQEFGAQGDLFADLLGATSPNTPVDTNWRFAIEVLTRFSKGEFDSEMKAFTDYVEGGGQPSKFPGAKIRQASGKLYGMNSKNSMLALADLWRAVEAGTAPKARNFALNLIGQSNMATIDVWAARMLRRAAGMVRGTDLPRIPTVAEQGVTGNWNTNTTAVTGEFGFGAAVLDRVSADLAKKGIDLSPPDLQALAWFAEKELWTEKNWTSAQGEGGSFEERIEDTPTSRYLMGFSVQQGDIQPEESAVTLAQARLLAQLRGDDSVISARVLPSYGLFMGKPEEALDLEWTVKKGQHSTALVMAEAAAIAKDRTQQAIFISRVLSPNEDHPNARPGAEVYFKKNIGIDRVKAVMDSFTTKGLDGFTLAVDPRAKPSSRPGQEFIGLRIQYIPEFDSVTPENVDAVMVERKQQLNDAVAELNANGDVAFASVYKYDTEVVSGENYDEYIDRGVASRDSAAGSEVRSGQSVRERLERAATRVQSDAGQNGSGSLPDASLPLAFANKQRGDDRGRAGDQGRQADDDGTQASKRTAAQKALTRLPGYPATKAHEGPDAKLASVAQAYAKANGITLKRQSEYAEIDVDRSTRLADAYAAMPHAPQDPKVKEAYANLIKQTVAQYKALEKAGYKFWLYDGDTDPYDTNPWNAMRDLRNNQSMGVFSTVAGFGSDASFDPAANPLLGDTGIKWPFGSPNGKLKPVLANDLFRAVHDAFGHGLEGTGFRANGEENAWQAHVRLFTGSAVGAITSETRGQNSWLNYGPAGEQNRTAGLFDTTFADQKTGLMPSWTWNEGRVGSEADPALDADITLDIPLDNGKTAKMTVNAQRYITQLDAREDALRMVKECML